MRSKQLIVGYTAYEPGIYQNTVASAMNINDPVSFLRIKTLYSEFDLDFFRSADEEITDTWAKFMSGGANICPQGADAIHAVLQARSNGTISAADSVVAISTASALTFTDAGIATINKGNRFPNPAKLLWEILTVSKHHS